MKILYILVILTLMPLALAESNESIEAFNSLTGATDDIREMREKGISNTRASELYDEAFALYDAQKTLEVLGKRTRFDLVIENTEKISEIKKTSTRAKDELNIFTESFELAKEDIDISTMQEDYALVVLSFNEERFEDTLILIEEGYNTLSDLESRQTTFNLFYSSTTENITNFIRTNWIKLLITAISGLIIFYLLWNTLQRILLRAKLNNLILRRSTIKELIKKLQSDYFTHKSIPTSSYHIKLKKFEDMILDINRQIPLLKEDMIKLRPGRIAKIRPIKAMEIKRAKKKIVEKKTSKKKTKKSSQKK